VVARKKSSDSSMEEDINSNNDYCSNVCGIRVHGTWRDIKSRHLVSCERRRRQGRESNRNRQQKRLMKVKEQRGLMMDNIPEREPLSSESLGKCLIIV
jgi:hypothetical protein